MNTLKHSLSLLKKLKISCEMVDLNELVLKKGYSIYELMHAMADIQTSPFYTYIIACGRRVLWSDIKHKYMQDFTSEQAAALCSGRRVRIYHIFKANKNVKIKFGWIKFKQMSNEELNEFSRLVQEDSSNILMHECWQFIDQVGGSLYPAKYLKQAFNV